MADELPQRGAAEPTSTLSLVIGIILGLVAGTLWGIFVMSRGYEQDLSVVTWTLLALLPPVAIGALLLAVPAWRRAGAGFVSGLAFGAIIFAGACASLLGYSVIGGL